jgi:hypothetical protein
MHMIMFSFAVIAVIAITAVLFVFWLIVAIFRGIGHLFLGPGLKQPRPISQQSPALDSRRCDRASCQTLNPPEARFCRRCGQRMEDPHRTAVRRAAML